MDYLGKMANLAKEHGIDPILMTPLLIHVPLAEKHWLPDIDYTEVNEKLNKLRSLMLEYGNKNGARIIDAQEQFSRLYTEENASEYLLDGLHPTLRGHEALAGML